MLGNQFVNDVDLYGGLVYVMLIGLILVNL